ncbi:maltose/moltooligosaccharide transporter [Algoriphagus iocasae]|jgi:maltose/moltooligosaccharide transporter|uniref:Maltose/moltooligosaccharide transporter n=1 Tax=Algoriphagus iocasae TaxID=1836499 RepID=A0A841MNH0_9BACT|nr:MFS transporter [Algoriphagus iocasae]MBB6327057.1 maltose/moltooligosaccharide transporter [Algoriphagus iocasae]
MRKPQLSFSQIINMNVGFFGIQYSFGLQQSAVNPIYDMLGAAPDEIPILNLAGPMTGLLIQPIIGALSDSTWSPRFGRRKPFFFIGALMCSICLFFYPFSSSLWMAAGLLWVLDAANNTAMEPYRALIADVLPDEQYSKGFLTQSFFTGLGITLANVSLFVFQKYIPGIAGSLPIWVYASFFLGTICSIGSVMWSISKTPEYPPSEEELAVLKERNKGMPHPAIQFFLSILTTLFAYLVLFILMIPALFDRKIIRRTIHWAENHPTLKVIFAQNLEIIEALTQMPSVMWKLALVYLFQWYALFCYWQNAAKSIAQSVWDTSPLENKSLYEEAVGWTGLVNGWYNIVTFLSAFFLAKMATKFGPKKVHFICLIMAGVGLLIFPHIENKYLLFAPMTGFGIAWASMMGVPYLLVVNEIPKERYGVYMGIINMMIVIPMILQTLSFGFISKTFLNNDPGTAITFAGALLLIGALAVLRIKENKNITESPTAGPIGH